MVLEICEKFIRLFPFLSRKPRESFSFRQTFGSMQSYKSRAAVVVTPCACHFLQVTESPEGKHLGTIVAPEHPHNFAWGDDDGRALYLCAKTGLYRIRLNIAGIRL
jgi:hypothetical protein